MRQMGGPPRRSTADNVLSTAAPAVLPSAVPAEAPGRRSAEELMRRVLRVPPAPSSVRLPEVRRAFSASVFLSAARCLSMYLILPFVLPAVGVAAQVEPGIGILLGGVAVTANILTIRRFWWAEHRWRWAYTPVAVAVIALLFVLMAGDVAELVG